MIKSKLMMIICAFMTFINAYAMRPNERNGGANSNKQYNISLINSNLTTVKNDQYIDHGKPQVIDDQGGSSEITLMRYVSKYIKEEETDFKEILNKFHSDPIDLKFATYLENRIGFILKKMPLTTDFSKSCKLCCKTYADEIFAEILRKKPQFQDFSFMKVAFICAYIDLGDTQYFNDRKDIVELLGNYAAKNKDFFPLLKSMVGGKIFNENNFLHYDAISDFIYKQFKQ